MADKRTLLAVALIVHGIAHGAMRPTPEYLKSAVVYQMVLRNFTRDGDFKSATVMLEHVRSVGVDVVYLSPFVEMDCDMDESGWSERQKKSGFVTPKNPYRISNYDKIDPEYGGDADFKAFNDKVFKNHDLINKHYLALVVGQVEKEKDMIDAPLKKDEETNTVKVAKNGKTAKTVYKLIKKYDEYSLLDVTLLTGRTHQIRVHMAYINHPIVGDSKYGDFEANRVFKQKYGFSSQFLHAYKIGFGDLPAPLTNLSRKEFTAEPREDIAKILTQLDNIKEE